MMKTLVFLSLLISATHLRANDLDCKVYIHWQDISSEESLKSSDQIKKISKILNNKGYQIVPSSKHADLNIRFRELYCSYMEKSKCLNMRARIAIHDRKTGEVGEFIGIDNTLFLSAKAPNALIDAIHSIDECK